MKAPTLASGTLLLACLACAGGSQPPGPDSLQVSLAALEAISGAADIAMAREVVLSGASAWVLDAFAPFLRRVSLETGASTALGTEGRGPGELRSPRAIQPRPLELGGGVFVWDYGNRRLAAFDSLGRLASTAPMDPGGVPRVRGDLEQVSYLDPMRIRMGGAGILTALYPRRLDHAADIVAGTLHRSALNLAPGPAVTGLADPAEDAPSAFRVWGDLPLWDACGGVVAVWRPTSRQVHWLGADGAVLGAVAVELRTTPITLTDMERYVRRMARLELGPDHDDAGVDYRAMAEARRHLFAENTPVATDLRCQVPGVAWIRLFDTEHDPLGRSRSWLRTSAGEAPLIVSFPRAFTPLLFTDKGVLGLLEAPGGAQRLGRWTEAPGLPSPSSPDPGSSKNPPLLP